MAMKPSVFSDSEAGRRKALQANFDRKAEPQNFAIAMPLGL